MELIMYSEGKERVLNSQMKISNVEMRPLIRDLFYEWIALLFFKD